jgi:hypothetical protein
MPWPADGKYPLQLQVDQRSVPTLEDLLLSSRRLDGVRRTLTNSPSIIVVNRPFAGTGMALEWAREWEVPAGDVRRSVVARHRLPFLKATISPMVRSPRYLNLK